MQPSLKMAFRILAVVATAMTAHAQTLTTVINFAGTNGNNPNGPLVQGLDGSLYGTTFNGGADPVGIYGGSIFRVTTDGMLATLYGFCNASNQCPHGYSPTKMIPLPDGGFYGITEYGGAGSNCTSLYTCSTIFQIAADGTLKTLHTFCKDGSRPCTDGAGPTSLILANDGNLYGTTYYGGINCSGGGNSGCGTVFRMTPDGTFSELYLFCSQQANSICADGGYPTGLVQGSDGNFYGTAQAGGNSIGPLGFGGGTVFKITSHGVMSVLHNFCAQANGDCADGAYPLSGVMQATDGFLYGSTSGGRYAGTIFRITMKGDFVKLHTFCKASGCPDGYQPQTGLIEGTDGNFYGVSYGGGTTRKGTAYQMTPSGVVTTLYTFCSQPNCADGEGPSAQLFQATNGMFYGVTASGGSYQNCNGEGGACGTIYSISMGLGPFIETLPAFGKTGATLQILGTDLTGATSVAFNGVAAAFTVVSTTQITATVPAGGTSGMVQVVTPGGTLTSNTRFQVLR